MKTHIGIEALMDDRSSVLHSQLTAGYLSPGTFSTTFSRSTGVSPQRFQRSFHYAFGTVKVYEAARVTDLLTYRNPQYTQPGSTGHSCRVWMEIPDDYQDSVVFVGLYPKPIANCRPIAGLALRGTGSCTLDHLPEGQYYVLACALKKSDRPSEYYLLDNCLRGCAGPVAVSTAPAQQITVPLRRTAPCDPPIVVNLPQLLTGVFTNTANQKK